MAELLGFQVCKYMTVGYPMVKDKVHDVVRLACSDFIAMNALTSGKIMGCGADHPVFCYGRLNKVSALLMIILVYRPANSGLEIFSLINRSLFKIFK